LKPIKSALVSVFHKDRLEPVIRKLNELEVTLYSTGGTEKFIRDLGIEVHAVESLTEYPSILGGRVKTLHPKIFGGILGRREINEDLAQLESYEIPEIDLVIVDLYPFEDTLASGASHMEIIEKIDIGGISLIRAAAKNYRDVMIVPSRAHYGELIAILENQEGASTEDQRKKMAAAAFGVSSQYDTAILNYFTGNGGDTEALHITEEKKQSLRYGENPHQKGTFFGDLEKAFDQLHGKELSYNNLLDIDAAVHLMEEFRADDPTFAILKHNNACGLSTRPTLSEAYADALAGDPVSAFGGILIANRNIDPDTARQINDLFCEVVIAPGYAEESLELLKSKKNRIILLQKPVQWPKRQVRSALNGFLVQDRDLETDRVSEFILATRKAPTEIESIDLEFASKVSKHTKSNTIVLAKNRQLLASGTGQTSRVDALKQAIHKAQSFGFDLKGAVMASDAFFPFPDCVEIANDAGITAVIQPGGSIKDQLSVDYCNENGLSMVFTGKRHSKH
jgi:phosphoribosylaminoimidazolecarboxamide formyltransferase/IMP cyclohydrolase